MDATCRFDRGLASIDDDLEIRAVSVADLLVHGDPSVAMGVLAAILVLERDVHIWTADERNRITTEIVLLRYAIDIADVEEVRPIKPFEFDTAFVSTIAVLTVPPTIGITAFDDGIGVIGVDLSEIGIDGIDRHEIIRVDNCKVEILSCH